MAPSKARSRFKADLESAFEKDYANVSHLGKGDAEDEFTLVFSHPDLPTTSQLEIHIQPQEVRSYPSDNTFLIYTNNDVPPAIAKVLEDSIFETAGMKVEEAVNNLCRRLRAALGTKGSSKVDNVEMADVDTDQDVEEEFGDPDDSDDNVLSDYYDEDLGYVGYDDHVGYDVNEDRTDVDKFRLTVPPSPSLLQRIRQDLLSVVQAGFHPGRVWGFEEGQGRTIISISIRASKLSLSEEMLEAWNLAASEYIVLLMHYDHRYSTFEDAVETPVGRKIGFRLRKCTQKKPTYQQTETRSSESTEAPNNQTPDDKELSQLWISKSIDDFMNDEFMSLLKLKFQNGVSWESAKEMFRQRVMIPESDKNSSKLPAQYMPNDSVDDDKPQTPLYLDEDYPLSSGEKSLPLIAMQFALHHLVRCTDYCTICHRKVETNFEAVRPYVCDNPLCLHQYMSLGFGPSSDFEIINQPHVVDLLVSFCYCSLVSTSQGRPGMREFPTGLGLQVPKIRSGKFASTKTPKRSAGPDPNSANVKLPHSVAEYGATLIDPVDIRFNWDESTATITRNENHVVLEEGQWVVALTPIQAESNQIYPGQMFERAILHHARIETIYGDTLYLEVVSRHTISEDPFQAIKDGAEFRHLVMHNSPGRLVLYDDELDELEEYEKAFSMLITLASLPSVQDMRACLMNKQPLAGQMARSASGLLRWIIASNRSYIVQVGAGSSDARHGEKIAGVPGWFQFRFAQGSPEKEALFHETLEGVEAPQKTLLAWHGSPMRNWHSIIRQGLDYSVTANGRAYGNGIYFASSFDQSMIYTADGTFIGRSEESLLWPRSFLKPKTVMSLNELANLPQQFTTCRNNIFVVQHCHWTRCRYLFIKSASGHDNNVASAAPPTTLPTTLPLILPLTIPPALPPAPPPTPGDTYGGGPEFDQAPTLSATGLYGQQLRIPKAALASARERSEAKMAESGTASGNAEAENSEEDEEEAKFLSQEGPVGESDFRPGTLDFSTLPQLEAPSYATTMAERSLGHEIKRLEKVQSSTPLHELGWYIDFGKMNNLFQWIVELHSFDQSLPLAQDMKKIGCTSVVLEIRFLRGFPVTPPFVRVVQPRFLPFMHGGGGHVTAGGALCMQLLTNSGWSPASSLESVLLQVRLAICSADPRPARLESTSSTIVRQYGISEAVNAYIRAAATHNWEVPPELKELLDYKYHTINLPLSRFAPPGRQPGGAFPMASTPTNMSDFEEVAWLNRRR
ncbi:hypothetical protein M426DRAFT_12575 [Hypoxylon sp. CI-4A]|nr:hypothetical protein M426DRAFT_12575 [Hypoxylon sp. CI-4A]